MRISDWSSDVCSSDLLHSGGSGGKRQKRRHGKQHGGKTGDGSAGRGSRHGRDSCREAPAKARMIAVVYAIPLRGERGLLRQAATVETGGLLVAFRPGDHLVLAVDLLAALDRPPPRSLVPP